MTLSFSGHHQAKKFGHKQVVRDVSFSVNLGEAVGLIGPNGAGKTTCFLMMAGLLKPDKGTLTLCDQDVTFWPLYRKAHLGLRYLPQDASIFRGMSVEENIMAVLELLEKDPIFQKEQLESLLTDFGLQAIRKSSALVLSGGERRRVEIARSMAGKPHFLLLDEPLAGIDPKSIDELRSLITILKTRDIGIIISDHNVRDILGLVDRAYVMYHGEILREGTPEALASDPKVRDVYLGHSFSF